MGGEECFLMTCKLVVADIEMVTLYLPQYIIDLIT